MVDIARKHVAPEYRVLVDAKAFLNTTIDDGVLYFTAGQIELMRNLMQYANRRSTFVSDYYIGYYLEPDDTDWDLIQTVVADLEEVLMGNPNTIWGYDDTYQESVVDTSMPAGISMLQGEVVPEGEVWVILGITAFVVSSTCNQIAAGFIGDPGTVFCDNVLNPASGQVYAMQLDLRLKEGHRAFARYYNMTLNDDAYAYFWGYKMIVPA